MDASLTPKLHASLVSEILALRREIDSKHNFIERLESNLHAAKDHNESLQSQLEEKTKETRNVNKELRSIEKETLTALEELSKKRDEAINAASEMKKKVDALQKKNKTQQEEHEQLQSKREQEYLQWQQERGKIQRRADLAESRLKMVVDDIAATQVNGNSNDSVLERHTDDKTVASGSPELKKRHKRQRSSISSIGSLQQRRDFSGASLADELNMDEDEEDEDEENDTEPSNSEARAGKVRASRLSWLNNEKARRVLGIVSNDEQNQEVDKRSPNEKARRVLGIVSNYEQMHEADKKSLDKSVLHRSESRQAEHIDDDTYKLSDIEESTPLASPSLKPLSSQNAEIEANQRKKRAPPHARDLVQHARTQSEPVPGKSLPRLAAMPDPPPGSTDTSPESETTLDDSDSPRVSISTQTDSDVLVELATKPENAEVDAKEAPAPLARDAPLPPPTREAPLPPERQAPQPPPTRAPPPPPVPVISIQRASRPSSPTEVKLPPGTKSIGCQTLTILTGSFRSIGTQTDVIRIDKRLVTLPPHLLPATLDGEQKDGSRAVGDAETAEKEKAEASPISPLLASPLEDMPAADDDAEALDQDLSQSSWVQLRRSLIRSSRISRTEEILTGRTQQDADLSDEEYQWQKARNKASKKYGRRKSFDPPTPVPEHEKVGNRSPTHSRARGSTGSRDSFEHARVSKSYKSFNSHSRGSSNTGASQTSATSSRKPGMNGIPFEIPLRSSSAGVRTRGRKASGSPNRTSGKSSPRRRNGRIFNKPPPLLRYGSSIPEDGTSLDDAPVFSPSMASFASKETRSSTAPVSRASTHHDRNNPSESTDFGPTSNTPTGNATVNTSLQPTVVDAIAVSMVGEWMWKYTRKRKAFGGSSLEAAKGSDVKHKRWVWLSPHEKTIMWDSKQPTSNAALMGKSGRTCVVQSVLDIKDDASMPKGVNPDTVFDRSILVLTPNRALKFSATTRERHYLWLTALSFLAHHSTRSSMVLKALPMMPAHSTSARAPVPSPNNSSARASSSYHRLPWSHASSTKGKSRSSARSSGYATPSIPQEMAPDLPTSSQKANAMTCISGKRDLRSEQQPVLSDAAMPPAVPRVPTKDPHSRQRSATTSGSNTRPSSRSRSAFASATPSLRTFSSTIVNSLSGNSTRPGSARNPGTRTGSSSGPSSSVPPVPSQRSGNTSAKQMTFDGVMEEEDFPVTSTEQGLDGTRIIAPDNDADRMSSASAEFGGCNNFFDAVGTLDRDVHTSTKRTHQPSRPSFDSVAPPNISKLAKSSGTALGSGNAIGAIRLDVKAKK